MKLFKRKKIGLALGGGGARGMAHIGVLKILEKNNIPIDMISGTSMGAAVGALYSLEPNAKKLEKEVLSMKWKELFDYTISSKGIIKGDRIYNFFKKRLKNANFSDLKLPLFVTAFDIGNKRGAPVVASASGKVIKVVNYCKEGSSSCGGKYGNYITIEHPNGMKTKYAHLQTVSVSLGASVSQGEKIGTIGNTGRSTGPHLHFEVIKSNGSTIRPPVY